MKLQWLSTIIFATKKPNVKKKTSISSHLIGQWTFDKFVGFIKLIKNDEKRENLFRIFIVSADEFHLYFKIAVCNEVQFIGHEKK